jgi:tripartite-type tricarboxylate transporter receptor subunit TctC
MRRRQFLQRMAQTCVALGSGASLAAFPSGPGAAATYPDRPVRVIVPYPGGGVVDIAARIVSDQLSGAFGQPFVIENRAGANGNIGAELAKTAKDDGYTLLVGSMFLVVNPLIDKTAHYSIHDFAPIASIGAPPNILLVPASSPIRSLGDLIKLAHAHPGKLSTPNPGTGSSNHLGLELFARAAGIDVLQIGYKGQPPFMADLINGELDFAFLTAALAVPYLENGKLRALAISSTQRLKALPEVPTFVEAGFPEAVVVPWNAFLAPAGVHPGIVATLGRAIEKALSDPAVVQRFETIHAEVPPSPLAFSHFVVQEEGRWKRVIAERNIKG